MSLTESVFDGRPSPTVCVIVALGVGLLSSCNGCQPCGPQAGQHLPFVDGGMGDPCDSDADCNAALRCLGPASGSSLASNSASSRVCSTPCAADCDAGQTCALWATSDAGSVFLCLPTCQSDAECLGVIAGTCPNPGSPCVQTQCSENAGCPQGYACEQSGASNCCTDAQGAALCILGWCQKE